MSRLTCIDLFSGCGGLTLGFQRAGFSVLAAVDVDPQAIAVLSKNLPDVSHPLTRDLTTFRPAQLAEIIGTDRVDVIAGGPPCQGFSTARSRDGANSGPRLVPDDRRSLYKEFLRYVDYFKPKVFLIENVVGIRSAAQGEYFTRLQAEARALGYRVHPQTEHAAAFGVPQKRVRQLIIGTRADIGIYFPIKLPRPPRAVLNPTLGEAIGDLPRLVAGGGTEEATYDLARRSKHVSKYGRGYLFRTLEVQRARTLTAHRARPHSSRDLRDFARLREGENSLTALKRGEHFEFPYDRGSFKDRYTRQHRNHLCSTIVAHLSKDGLMFVHPTQARSLTPREAARIQSFPDWFAFPVARTHQFRLIGNAVPPLVAEALGLAAAAFIGRAAQPTRTIARSEVPSTDVAAAASIRVLLQASREASLRKIPRAQFRRGWFAIGYLYPGLHPQTGLGHGLAVAGSNNARSRRRLTLPELTLEYVQSGWPVDLVPVLKEAKRRHEAGEFSSSDFYCDDAAVAGSAQRSAFEDRSSPAIA